MVLAKHACRVSIKLDCCFSVLILSDVNTMGHREELSEAASALFHISR